MNGGAVFAVFNYSAHESDELSFSAGTKLSVVRKGDDAEREWWWARATNGQEGYVPRNLLGVNILNNQVLRLEIKKIIVFHILFQLYPRVTPKQEQ